MCMNFLLMERKNDDEFFLSVEWKNDDEFFISGVEKRRGVAEKYYKREADWKATGEERSDEGAGILSDNISGTTDSEELLVLSAIYYIINMFHHILESVN